MIGVLFGQGERSQARAIEPGLTRDSSASVHCKARFR